MKGKVPYHPFGHPRRWCVATTILSPCHWSGNIRSLPEFSLPYLKMLKLLTCVNLDQELKATMTVLLKTA